MFCDNTKLIIHHAYTGTYGDIILTGNGMPQMTVMEGAV